MRFLRPAAGGYRTSARAARAARAGQACPQRPGPRRAGHHPGLPGQRRQRGERAQRKCNKWHGLTVNLYAGETQVMSIEPDTHNMATQELADHGTRTTAPRGRRPPAPCTGMAGRALAPTAPYHPAGHECKESPGRGTKSRRAAAAVTSKVTAWRSAVAVDGTWCVGKQGGPHQCSDIMAQSRRHQRQRGTRLPQAQVSLCQSAAWAAGRPHWACSRRGRGRGRPC